MEFEDLEFVVDLKVSVYRILKDTQFAVNLNVLRVAHAFCGLYDSW
jgi:hypothetical protein